MTALPLLRVSRRLGVALKKRRLVLVTAESCTGGWIAQAVTAVAGSSTWFDRGFVTYSNDAKRELLGVRARTLSRYGAVSEKAAGEMAIGALGRSRADVAVAVTGIAGPDGGTQAKPVGTVCFAWALRTRPVASETRRFRGSRDAVRRRSVIFALEGLLMRLEITK